MACNGCTVQFAGTTVMVDGDGKCFICGSTVKSTMEGGKLMIETSELFDAVEKDITDEEDIMIKDLIKVAMIDVNDKLEAYDSSHEYLRKLRRSTREELLEMAKN